VSLLEVRGLDAFYGHFQALFDLSLSVDAGETLAIIGANGAGKSTFLNTVAGLLPSAADAVLYRDRPIGDMAGHRRVEMGISLVPEGRRLFPSLTVEENLRVGTWSGRRGPWTVDRIYDLFPMLRARARHPAGLLSGGEQQATAIGRALMANPDLLLMDEISLGLAPIAVKRLYEVIPGIVADGTTLVIVEQDVTQAMRVADRVVCFLEGRVSLHGHRGQVSREAVRAAYFGV
jgi:branched-chain amino acid transport system ATP-binding protein